MSTEVYLSGKHSYQTAAADHAIDVNTVVVCIDFEEVYWTVHVMMLLQFMAVNVI